MSSYRLQRVQNLLQEATSDIIRRIKDPRVGFCSVTRVEVSPDLRHCKVFVSVMGDEKTQKATLDGLNNAHGFVRHELSREVRLRHIPEVTFKLDQALEESMRVLSLIQQVSKPAESSTEEAPG